MAVVPKALLFSAPFVGVVVGAVSSQSGGGSQGSLSESVLNPVKESVSSSSESSVVSLSESEAAPAPKVCSIVLINGPDGIGQKITTTATFNLETLKSQHHVVVDSSFYRDVTDACNKTNPSTKPSAGDAVYVTYSGSAGNYSKNYQKDWKSKNWVRR